MEIANFYEKMSNSNICNFKLAGNVVMCERRKGVFFVFFLNKIKFNFETMSIKIRCFIDLLTLLTSLLYAS